MRELTDQQIDRIFSTAMADEAEQRVQPRATSAEMTARVRAATRQRSYRRPLLLMAAALLIAGSAVVWIGTRPNLNSQGGPVNCVSTLPEGWRLRLNLAPPGGAANIITLDRDGRLIRGSDNATNIANWSDRPRSTIDRLTPAQADAFVAAIDEAYPEGYCGTIANDPIQATSPSIESAGGHFVMVNGRAMQRARVSSQEEIRDFNRLISSLTDLLYETSTEQTFEPESFNLIVASTRGQAVGPGAATVRLPGGQSLSTVGSPIEDGTTNNQRQSQIPSLVETRCLTIPSEDADEWAAAMDASGAWSIDNGAWLYADDPELQTFVRFFERRPYQPDCTKPLWPQANAEESVTSPMSVLDPCELISPQEMSNTFGRRSTGEIAPWYFPDAEGCIYRFNVADRAPPVVGIRLSETKQHEFQRLAEFYLGTEGLTQATTPNGYQAFYNGCDTVLTSTNCAAVVASEPYLAIVYLPFAPREDQRLLRELVDTVSFPMD